MNDKRRSRLSEAVSMIKRAHSIVRSVCDEEEDSMDRIPENMENSVLHSRMEDAIDELESASDDLESAVEYIERAKSV